jgi:hypothetical protein
MNLSKTEVHLKFTSKKTWQYNFSELLCNINASVGLKRLLLLLLIFTCSVLHLVKGCHSMLYKNIENSSSLCQDFVITDDRKVHDISEMLAFRYGLALWNN